ncbi:MAG: transcriptional regulator [Candidatus Thiodiazotropha sp.]
MLIEGPLKIAVLDDPTQPGRELHLDFTTEFRAMTQGDQAAAFARYLAELQQGIVALPTEDPNRAGMLIVQQIADTIIVEMGRDYSSDSLMSLLNS